MGSMGRRPSARASSVRDLLRSGYCCPIRKNKYWQYMSNARWKPEIVLSYRMRQHFFKFWEVVAIITLPNYCIAANPLK